MREKIDAATESRISFAILASGLIHLFVIALPYFMLTHNVVHSKDSGSLPAGAVIKVTFASVSPAVLTKADGVLLAIPGTVSSVSVQAATENRAAADAARAKTGLSISEPQVPLIAYYPVERLTKRPQPMSSVQLDAPAVSPLIASGKIAMKLWINEWGGVNDAVVENSDLPAKFSETCVAAMRQLKFTPGEFYGRKVAAIMKIEISYDDFRIPPTLDSVGVKPADQ